MTRRAGYRSLTGTSNSSQTAARSLDVDSGLERLRRRTATQIRDHVVARHRVGIDLAEVARIRSRTP